jgi:spore maturation protein A
MNAIFTSIFFICTLLLLCLSPEQFLAALLDGAGKGATVCVSLVATYSVWLGLMHVWEDSGLARALSRLTKPLAKRLFRTEDEETLQVVSMNLSVNILGISGAATPYGIRAAKLFNNSPNAEYSSAMLFVLNATSLQLIPTSIIGVRVAMGSASPNFVIIPTLLASLLTTILAVTLTRLFIPPNPCGERERSKSSFAIKKLKTSRQV